MDRLLKSNTSKPELTSVFRQGCMLYELVRSMPEHSLVSLMAAFEKAISGAREFSEFLAQPD